MGANSPLKTHTSCFSEAEWEPTPIVSYTKLKDPYYGSNYKMLTNKLNRNLEVEKYDLVFSSYSQYSTYKSMVLERNSHQNIVASKYFQQISEQGLCSSFHYATIFIQRIPIRLFEIQDIELEEGLLILYSAIQGFEVLHQKYGYFEIESQMICFTKEGSIKVWINKNLSKIYPETVAKQTKGKTYNQFISKLLFLVQKLIDFENKMTISQFIYKKKLKKPLENMTKIIQSYIKQYRITLPRYLSSIRNLCNSKRKLKCFNSKRSSKDELYDLSQVNRSFAAKKMDKSIDLNNTVHNFSVKPSKNIDSTQFSDVFYSNKKRHSFLNTYHPKSISFTKIPPINFQYNSNIFPDSPKNISYSTQQDILQKINIPIATKNTIKQKQSSTSTYKKCQFMSVDDQFEMDPQIAADLIKISEHSL